MSAILGKTPFNAVNVPMVGLDFLGERRMSKHACIQSTDSWFISFFSDQLPNV